MRKYGPASSNSALAPLSWPSNVSLAPLGPGRMTLVIPPTATTTIPAIVTWRGRSLNGVLMTISGDRAGHSKAMAATVEVGSLQPIALTKSGVFDATASAVANPCLSAH